MPTARTNLKSKVKTYLVWPCAPAGRELKVARLQLGENWDPEPGAWRRLSAVLHNSRKIDLKITPAKVSEDLAANYKIAILTGTTQVILSADQRKMLKEFVEKGGTLIVDA